MKILVTGGAGFIGSHVVDKYTSDGHDVAVVDNLSTGSRSNLNSKARFYDADIRDAGVIDGIFQREHPDVVNHHAAQVDVRKSVEDPVFDATSNILGSLQLIHASVKHNLRKFIYVSTGGAVYGEPKYLPVDEDHPLHPESQYGISKHTVEHYLYLYKRHSGLTYTVLRYPNVYGPRQNSKGEAGVIAIFVGQMLEGVTPTIFGNGEQLRDYVHVDDIVRVNSLALTGGDNEIFNIGSGVGTTVNRIYRLLSDLLSFRQEPNYAVLRTGEIQRIYLSAQRAYEQLGWKSEIPIEEGLRLTLDWFTKKMALSD